MRQVARVVQERKCRRSAATAKMQRGVARSLAVARVAHQPLHELVHDRIAMQSRAQTCSKVGTGAVAGIATDPHALARGITIIARPLQGAHCAR